MQKLVLTALFGVLTVSAWAETSGTWAGYVTYGSPAATALVVPAAELRWLDETVRLLPPGGFTFLGRRDADHWMALTNKGGWWLLQIHDETARFNFRAQVTPAGKIAVEKGVDWTGLNKAQDAAQAAGLALAYLERARSAEALFPGPPGAHDAAGAHDAHAMPAASHGAAPAHDAPASAHDAPAAGHAAPATGHGASVDPALGTGGTSLWQKLVDGNLRFVSGQVTHPNQDMARIEETAKGQHPFAIVVSCSDSRVPPEVLFDQGIGDLFVVRTAGEVVTEVELGSIEYAVEHLGATYLVVLGHKKCGAVDATLKGGDVPPNIEAIAAQIRPAVEAARFFKGDALDNAVRENAKTVLAKIKGSEILAEAMHAGKLNLKAAYYDIDTGKVAALP
jgi:carbonic anhydrase